VLVLPTGTSFGLSQRHSKRQVWRVSRPLATALASEAGAAVAAAARARTRQATGCMVIMMRVVITQFSWGVLFLSKSS